MEYEYKGNRYMVTGTALMKSSDGTWSQSLVLYKSKDSSLTTTFARPNNEFYEKFKRID